LADEVPAVTKAALRVFWREGRVGRGRERRSESLYEGEGG